MLFASAIYTDVFVPSCLASGTDMLTILLHLLSFTADKIYKTAIFFPLYDNYGHTKLAVNSLFR